MVTDLVAFLHFCTEPSASLSYTRTPPAALGISGTSRRMRPLGRAASVPRGRSGWSAHARDAGCWRTSAACPSAPRSEPQVQGQPSSFLKITTTTSVSNGKKRTEFF